LKKIFVDTNIFIRYLVNDIPEQVDCVEQLFDLAEKGELTLFTGPPVFFEIAWTLKSFYKLKKEQIYECLRAIIGLPGLKVLDLEIVEEAIELFYATSADFRDAYLAVLSKKERADAVATFNAKHFKDLGVEIYPLTF